MRNACKNYTKIAVLAELIACLLTASSVSVEAQAVPTEPDSPETEYVRVYVNGEEYTGRAVLYEDTTYVDINTFAKVLVRADMAWNEESGSASVW